MLWRAPWLRQRLGLAGLAMWDSGALYVSYNITYMSRLGRWEGVSVGLAVIIGSWVIFSYLAGQYSPTSGRYGETYISAILKTIGAGALVMVVFISHSWVYQVFDAQTRFRGFLIPVIASGCLMSLAGRALFTRMHRRKDLWLLIGSQKEKDTMEKEIRGEGVFAQMLTSLEFLSKKDQLSKDLIKEFTGISLGKIESRYDDLYEELVRVRGEGGKIIPLQTWCEQELQRIPPELIDSEWLVQAEGFGLRPGNTSWRIKRLGDVIGSLSLIVATAPLVILGGLCVWVNDRGPVFYSQVRTGLYGKRIRIWKLRSMVIDAEKSGVQWASKSDTRVTRIGKVLRATRIDELPQLLSVLSGDLSLIGPRPERPEIEEALKKEIPNYLVRSWIRPGLTGWAQVCYPYGASIKDSRMKLSYDLYYLRNSSILLDVLISLKTVRLVVGAKGASPKSHSEAGEKRKFVV